MPTRLWQLAAPAAWSVFITAVGDDDLGKKALDLYGRQGIDISHVRICDGVPSGVALIFVGDDGENMIGVASAPIRSSAPKTSTTYPIPSFEQETCCWLAWKSRLKQRRGQSSAARVRACG